MSLCLVWVYLSLCVHMSVCVCVCVHVCTCVLRTGAEAGALRHSVHGAPSSTTMGLHS